MNSALIFVPESAQYIDYISVLYKGELSDIMTVLTKMIRHSYKKLDRYLDVENLHNDFLITKNDKEGWSEIHIPIIAEFLKTYKNENPHDPIYQITFNGHIISLFPTPIHKRDINFRVVNYTNEEELDVVINSARNEIKNDI